MLIEIMVRRTFGIKRHVVQQVEEKEGELRIGLEARRGWRLPCGRCGALGRVRDRLRERSWRHVPLWGIPVRLGYAPARVACRKCGKIRVEAIPWSAGKSRLSQGLIWLLARWAKLLAWQQVAELFQVSWSTVAGAVKTAVAYGLEHRDLGGVLYIGMDELSRRKGRVFVTNVYDLEERRLIWSGEGRKRETLAGFFQQHGERLQTRVVAVCCDMWQPYIDMIKEHFPEALLVFDKFHITQHLLRSLDEVRRQEAAELGKTHPG